MGRNALLRSNNFLNKKVCFGTELLVRYTLSTQFLLRRLTALYISQQYANQTPVLVIASDAGEQGL